MIKPAVSNLSPHPVDGNQFPNASRIYVPRVRSDNVSFIWTIIGPSAANVVTIIEPGRGLCISEDLGIPVPHT